MKKLILSFLAVVILVSANAQYRFHTSYNAGSGANLSHMHDDVYPDWRGGFYCLSTAMGTIEQGDALVRVNANGTLAFSRFITGDGSVDFKPTKLVVSSDKFVYMAGYGDASYGYSTPVFVKTDSLGAVIWSRTFELMTFQGQFEARSMVITSDGGFLAMFSRMDYSVPMGQTSSATVLIKVNSSGSLQWSKEFRGTTINNYGMKLVTMGNEVGVIMQGNDINNSNLQYSALYIINNSGTVLKSTGTAWNQSSITVSVPMNIIEGVAKKANGEYLIGTNYYNGTSSAGMLIQVDNALAVMSARLYTNQLNEGVAFKYIREEAGGDVSCLGTTFGVLGDADGLYARLNAGFIPQSAVAYGDSRGNDMFNFGVTTDEGFYLGGSSVDGMSPFQNQSALYKIDKEGGMGCNEAAVTINSVVTTPTLQTVAFSFNNLSFSNSSPTVAVNALTLTTDYVCSSLICNVQLSSVVNHLSCFQSANGAINLTFNNAQAPVGISWTGPSFTSSSEDISGLIAGTYSVSVTDAIGCTATASYVLTQPAQLAVNATFSSPSCTGDNDGSINLTVSGGTPNYAIAWTGPNSFSSSQEDINGLLSGTYNVFVTDNNSCNTNSSFVLTEPTPLGATFAQTQPSCNGGTDGEIVASGTGGTAPYNYIWTGGGPGTAQYSGIGAGSYQVVVSDDNGCLYSTSSILSQPAALTAFSSQTAPTCQNANGSIAVSVSGGTGAYSYLWSGGGTSSSLVGVAEGTYTLAVSDANGCLLNLSYDLDNVVNPVEICVVTVDTTSQHNVIIWDKPVMTGVAGYNIYRLVGANYQQIGYWPYDSLSQYTDSAVGINPNVTSYRYRISVVDSCGNESAQSDFHETMHLTVNQGTGGIMNLIWDNYEGLSSFTYYKIGRFVNGSPNWVVIDSVTSANTTYSDLNAPNGSTVQYRVNIVLDAPCIATRAVNHNSTRSNRTAGIQVNGIAELEAASLSVFPNPGSDGVTILLPENSQGGTVEVMDITGAIVLRSAINGNNAQMQLSTSMLASGVYVIRLSGNDVVYLSRWVKQ